MQQFFEWLGGNWVPVGIILSLVVDISPIKINPWKTAFGWIGQLITADVMKEIREIKETQKEQQATIDENEKDRIRFEVLDFANSCRRGVHHTKDEFEHIISLHVKYERLLKKTNDENGVFTEEYNYILEIYHECQREDKFV